MSTPAGWYPDPEDRSQQRYWDGTAWTAHAVPLEPTEPSEPTEPTAVLPPVPPAPPPPVAPPAHLAPDPSGQGPKAWYEKKWVWGAAAVVVAVGVVGALGGGEGDTKDAADGPAAVTTVTAPAPPPATVTVQAEPEDDDGDEPRSDVGNDGEADGDTFIMPDEVGKDLQTAQDDLQAITDNPFFFSGSEDATGQGRFQAWDRNWVVCSQKPAAGKRLAVDSTDVVFFVVKEGEDCP